MICPFFKNLNLYLIYTNILRCQRKKDGKREGSFVDSSGLYDTESEDEEPEKLKRLIRLSDEDQLRKRTAATKKRRKKQV